ncbi:monocarboxylate transporter 10 isoform X2 [Cephus cinctus]|uniref:Monocarboxylate transporter 10 isoform X2 n=1 Tax=Cephus cinctus TaxID=211228 RepID=A0AAJ7BYT2_CEPCN|nr:monocarboxylate transporter 10 isoform X2 [Cephus cinctus]
MTIAENLKNKDGSNPHLKFGAVKRSSDDADDGRDSSKDSRSGNSQVIRRDEEVVNESQCTDVTPLQNFNPDSKRQHENGLLHERTVLSKAEVDRKDLEIGSDDREGSEPPDGGVRAWMIMVGSFVINGVLFSVINTYSLIYIELRQRLIDAGETEASFKAALVGSLTIGTTFFLSPIAGILTDKIGIQITTFIGGALASGGMFLSSLLTDKVEALYLTYGVMYGLGASLAYTPSLVILGHYFKRYLGLVNGIVTAGSSVFTILIPYLMDILLKRIGLEGTLRSLAGLTAVVMACAVLFKPITLKRPVRQSSLQTRSFRRKLQEIINVSIWKRKRYVVWASAIPLALFGYFVPYVHIATFVEKVFKDADGKLPVMCIGISSGIGRLVFGYIADLPRVDRVLLQQISFISIGILTMLLPVTSSFILLLLISLCMGLFDGCFISLLGPIAFDICGQQDATQAIGFLLGMCSIPLTVGPPIAALLYDHTGSYDLPFLLAGVPPIVGALAMFFVRCVKDDKTTEPVDPACQSLNSTWQNGNPRNSTIPPPYTEADENRRRQGFSKREGKELQDLRANGNPPTSP